MTTPTTKQPSVAPKSRQEGQPKRHWHRRPGLKIDDLLLKRHQHSAHQFAPLARLISQSNQRESLTQAVQALLPDDLRDTVEVVNYRAPSLVLRVGNASLATRLRYSLPDLTTKLRNLADFQGLTKINLRVVQTFVPVEPEKEPRYLPAKAAKSLAEFAELLQDQSDYHQLGETILRLSEHTLRNDRTSSAATDESGEAQTAASVTTSANSSPAKDTSS